MLASGLAVALLALAGLVATVPDDGATATAADDPSVTLNGTGRFADLAVTVSQTTRLLNQAVSISWSGGKPTQPVSGGFGTHYLQIMQCWGDDPAGPKREQCQYGARSGDARGGAWAGTRQTSYGSALVDAAETYVPPAGSLQQTYVPFESVTGKAVATGRNEFFDANTTNEVTFAKTRSDGKGSELFEVQTNIEAPGLGCGEVAAAHPEGRACWLVVVPRDDVEVDGTPRSGEASSRLESSPLSATNWAQRLVFPLAFTPLGEACPFGKERPLVGAEPFVEAVSRWQPALCADGGASYVFSQVSDPVAHRQLSSADPGMIVTSTAVDPSSLTDGRQIVYAPLTTSALGIGFLVERQLGGRATDADAPLAGTRMERLRLTPRVVAKLLTQSYGDALPLDAPSAKGKPVTLSADPDFVADNPDFSILIYTALSDVLVPAGQADVVRHLWEWVDADADARAFLDGKPDPWGMTVNPTYKGLPLPVADLPKADTWCQPPVNGQLTLCALERRPFASDLHEAGRSASRGDLLARQTWDPLSSPPSWKRSEPQPVGSRAVLALIDTPTAARYGLQMAELRNAAGKFVAPGQQSIAAAVDAMKDRQGLGVLEPLLGNRDEQAYPLPVLTYAATAPGLLDEEARTDYSRLLRHAAEDGQEPGLQPGTLPAGYLSLTEALRTRTEAAAAEVLKGGTVVRPTAPGTAAPAGSPSEPAAAAGEPIVSAVPPGGGVGRPVSAGGQTGAVVSNGGAPLALAPVPVSPSRNAAPTAAPVELVAQPRAQTPDDVAGASRLAVLLALLVGAACLTGTQFPVSRSVVRGVRRPTVRRGP